MIGKAQWLRPWLLALAHVYFIGLAAWLLMWALLGDRWPWLFAVNSLGVYLFAPLPLTALLALFMRRWEFWIWTGLGAAAWAYLFGALFLPPLAAAQAGGPTLRVMTYNLLGHNRNSDSIVAALRAADADLVALQELNPHNAAAIERELGEVYPYRVMDQREGVTGSGILSRYPVQYLGHLPGPWLGTTHVISITVEGRPVTVIRFHAYSGPDELEPREAAARILADYVGRHPEVPIVAMGDLNATPLNTAYEIVTWYLIDAWSEAGWGLGHTFPGAASPGSSRPRILGIPVPKWLVRIDFVLHSPHFRTLSAEIGPWDGVSDHRPVLAELAFVD